MMTWTTVIRFALVALVLNFMGCATQTELRVTRLGAQAEPEVVPGKIFYPANSNKANVGDIMFTAGEFGRNASGLILETFRVEKSVLIKANHKSKTFEFSIPQGDYRLRSRNADGNYYAAPVPFSGLNGTAKGYGGLFIPTGASAATEFYWSWTASEVSVYQVKLRSPITGSLGESTADGKDQARFGPRATLTYAGVAAGQIRFVYKEFTADGLARPAFTQEVSLDYKPGGTYAYKEAQFIVEEADSTHITFRILRPL